MEAAANLQGEESSKLKEDVLQKIDEAIASLVSVNTAEAVDQTKIVEEFSEIINFDPNSRLSLQEKINQRASVEEITEFLTSVAHDIYQEREKQLGPEIVRQMETFVYLTTIDTLWIEHLDTMDDLRAGIGLRGYGQRDPLVEYKKEAFELFSKLIATIDYEVVHRIYKVAMQGQPPIQTPQPIQVETHPEIEIGVATETQEIREVASAAENPTTKVTIERGGQVIAQENYGAQGQLTKTHGKLGRNDPCWCGSGKKYKRCHYPN